MPYLKTDGYQDPAERPQGLSKKFPIAGLSVVVLVLSGAFFVWQAKARGFFPRFSGNSESVSSTNAIVAKVARLVAVPAGEVPLVGTVTNAAALRVDQDFFAAAENGDVVLVYARYQRAVLYRPSRDILVNMGPIVYTPPTGSRAEPVPVTTKSSVSPVVKAPALPVVERALKLDFRNGSRTAGAAARLAKTFSAEGDRYDVISVVPAARTSYRGVTLVVLPGTPAARLEELKKKLGNPTIVTELPAGESKTSADCVIILGNT